MKFVELKKSLKSWVLPAYCLLGNDDFLVNRAYSIIIDALNIEMPEMNVNVYNEDAVDFADVVKGLETLPFFGNKRLVYVNLINKNSADVKNIKDLENYLSSPSEYSVLVVNCGAELKDYFKTTSKLLEVVDCNKLDKDIALKFIIAEAKKVNKTFTLKALDCLFDYTLGDLSKMNQELVKLCSYVGDREQIEETDVTNICTKCIEFQIFELTNALAKKDSEKVFNILNVLKSKKDEYRNLVGLIYNSFRRLMFVSITKESKDKLADMLGIQPYAVTKAQEQARMFSKKTLKEINDICMQVDYDIKNSNISALNGVDYIVLKILNA